MKLKEIGGTNREITPARVGAFVEKLNGPIYIYLKNILRSRGRASEGLKIIDTAERNDRCTRLRFVMAPSCSVRANDCNFCSRITLMVLSSYGETFKRYTSEKRLFLSTY